MDQGFLRHHQSAAILHFGSPVLANNAAVVKNGQLAVATVMTCTLSVDHRSVDVLLGAEFCRLSTVD